MALDKASSRHFENGSQNNEMPSWSLKIFVWCVGMMTVDGLVTNIWCLLGALYIYHWFVRRPSL